MKKGLKLGAVAAVLLGAMSSQSYALDCDGTNTCALGATSNGNFDITLVNAAGVRIWGLEDFVFDTNGTTTTQTGNADVCVFTNSASSTTDGQYDIIATGSDVVMTNGAGDTLNYTVEFKDSQGVAGTYQTLISAGALGPEAGNLNAGTLASQPDPSTACAGENANIKVTVDPTGAASTGTYLATVSLTISPN